MKKESAMSNKEVLTKIVSESQNYSEVIRFFELKKVTSNFRTLQKYIKLYEIDTSHFSRKLGPTTRKGKPKEPKKIGQDLLDLFIDNTEYECNKIKSLYFQYLKSENVEIKCSICNLQSWRDKEIKLHVDHINGNNIDNRLENLRLLCPNCHSQTETFCGKNIKK